MVWLRCIEVLRESEKELITTALAAALTVERAWVRFTIRREELSIQKRTIFFPYSDCSLLIDFHRLLIGGDFLGLCSLVMISTSFKLSRTGVHKNTPTKKKKKTRKTVVNCGERWNSEKKFDRSEQISRERRVRRGNCRKTAENPIVQNGYSDRECMRVERRSLVRWDK